MPGKIHRQCVENSCNATENFKTVHSRHISVNGNDLYLHVVTFQRVPKGRHWSSMPKFAGKKNLKKIVHIVLQMIVTFYLPLYNITSRCSNEVYSFIQDMALCHVQYSC